MMANLTKKIGKVPPKPGIYFLKDKKGKIIYIGKAKNLKDRLKSHYDLKKTGNIDINNPFGNKLYSEFTDFKFKILNSEIEALVEESKYIKKLNPKYNIALRDDKNYFYVGFTKDSLPRLFLTHQPKIKPHLGYIGPFTSGTSLKYSLKLIRRIYPFKTCTNKLDKPCFYFYLGLCPAHLSATSNLKQVKSITAYNLNKVKQILQGKTDFIIMRLKRQLKAASDGLQYEKASKILKEIKALENIFKHKNIIRDENHGAKFYSELLTLQQILRLKTLPKRIEIYDISNLGKDYIVGAMTVFANGKIASDEFRLFKIKRTTSVGDPQRIYEILSRRLIHSETNKNHSWPKPDIILIDGGKTQLLHAAKALKSSKVKAKNKIKLISLAKQNNILYIYNSLKNCCSIDLKQKNQHNLRIFSLFLIRSAHRFAKKYLNKVLLQKTRLEI